MRAAALHRRHCAGRIPPDRNGVLAEVHRPARGLLPGTLQAVSRGRARAVCADLALASVRRRMALVPLSQDVPACRRVSLRRALAYVLGAGLVGVVIWNVFAAVAANYLYYMHIKLSLAVIEQRTGLDEATRDRLITDAGGVQPYVWWLGIGLTAMAIAAGIMETPAPVKPPSSGAPD